MDIRSLEVGHPAELMNASEPGLSRRALLAGSGAAIAVATMPAFANAAAAVESIMVEPARSAGPLPHIWSASAGSDRAAITLREQWRQDVARFKNETGLRRVRFHGIFADEMGVYAPSILNPRGAINWQNVDQVYDGILALGLQPFVELSFMPQKLASGTSKFGFYGGNTSLPTSMDDWAAFIREFVTHLVERYGAAEVRQWYFEVWNEPNLRFFLNGTQEQYFALYKATAMAVRSVDPTLKVGGPATSGVEWIPEFLTYCHEQRAPLDFISTHIYAGDRQKPIFGRDAAYSQNDVIPAAMAKVRSEIDASPFKGLPLWLSEWSSDSPAMIAHVIKGCLPSCQGMSQWVASGAYEELGVADYVLKEGDGGWSMMAARGIPRPAFNTYKLLHRLGETRLATSDSPVLATRRSDGSLAILVWNLANVQQASGIPGASATRTTDGQTRTFNLTLAGMHSGTARISQVDQERGSALPAWRAMGSPRYPTPKQITQLRAAAELPAPATARIGRDGTFALTLPPEGVALIEIARA